MEQVFEMKVKEKKKKLKDSEAEVSEIVVQRNKVLQLGFTMSDVIYQTRETVFHRDIQKPRRELKIRRATEYF